jgi:uncharacterized protein
MRYLASNRDAIECLEVAAATGSMPPAILVPELSHSTRVALEPIVTLRKGPFNLFLATHTASWCLLDDFEARVAVEAKGQSFGTILAAHPELNVMALTAFFVQLYQRGLLRLDGNPGVDPGLLSRGALFHEGNLVEILITQKCNLACRYCLAEAGPDMPHMQTDVAYRAVDEAFSLPDQRPLAIQLSGGEPLANFQLFKEVVNYIQLKKRTSTHSVKICTQSNATLIDDEISDFLKVNQIDIGISIDGPIHLQDQTRRMLGGRSSFDKTIRGIKTLRLHGIHFGIILVLSRANVEFPEAIADFISSLEVTGIKINPISRIGDAQTDWAAMAITNDQYFEFMNRFIRHTLDKGLRLREANLAEYLKYLVHRIHDYRCMRSNCGAGKSFFLVDAKGDVYPCAHSAGIKEWRLGTVHDSQGDLVELGAKNAIVKRFKDRLVDKIPDTRFCPWRHFCEGGCAVNAHQTHGTIVSADSLCGFYERIYPRLLELLATSPSDFQRLLNTTFGAGKIEVVNSELRKGLSGYQSPFSQIKTTIPATSYHH